MTKYEVRCGVADPLSAQGLVEQQTAICLFQSAGELAGRQQLDAAAVTRCFARFDTLATSLTCDKTIETVQFPGTSWGRCDPELFEGTVPRGGACFDTEDCRDADTFCDERNTCPGVCAAATPVGQPLAAGMECVRGAQTVGGVCRAAPRLGEACGPSTPFCEAGAECTAGRCTPIAIQVATVGQTCGAAACKTSWCDPQNSLCAPFAREGEPCDLPYSCLGGLSCSGGTCIRPQKLGGPCGADADCYRPFLCATVVGSVQGICRDLGGPGQTCTGFFECNADSYCDGATCKARARLGDACPLTGVTDEACGAGLFCTSTGRCAALKQVNDTCTRAGECLASSCASGRCAFPNPCAAPR